MNGIELDIQVIVLAVLVGGGFLSVWAKYLRPYQKDYAAKIRAEERRDARIAANEKALREVDERFKRQTIYAEKKESAITKLIDDRTDEIKQSMSKEVDGINKHLGTIENLLTELVRGAVKR